MASQHGKFHIPRRVSSAASSGHHPPPSSSRRAGRERQSATPTPYDYNHYVVDDRLSAFRQSSRTDDEGPLPIQSNSSAPSATSPEERVILSTIAETSLPNEDMHAAGSGTGARAEDRHHLNNHYHNHLQPDLRQRASSPLLGQSNNSRRHHTSRPPESTAHPRRLQKPPLRAAESASALHASHHDPLQLPPTAPYEPTATTDRQNPDLSSGLFPPHTSHSATDLKSTPPNNMGGAPQERGRRNSSSKSKLRPMMDLSRLFPKPRDRSPRLLSPTRMMASPSPVSVVSSEESSNRAGRSYAPQNNKWTTGARRNDSISLHQDQENPEWQNQFQQQQEEDEQSQYEQEYAQTHPYYERRKVPKPFRTGNANTRARKPGYSNWFDGPLGQVSDDEDSGIDIDSERRLREEWPAEDHSTVNSTYSNAHSNSHYASSVRSNRTGAISGASSLTVRPSPSRSRRTSSAKTLTIRTPSTITDRERSLRSHPPDHLKPAPPKQNHSAGFGSSDLNESSVLCLSSDDEEEAEDQEGDQRGASKSNNRTFMRDSVADFDDSEICTTKSAVTTSRGPSTRSAKSSAPPPSKSSSHASPQNFEFHLPRRSSQRSQTADRRSRFLAVTRQEEHLLESLRRNRGAIPPSFFSDSDSIESNDTNPARQSLTGHNSESSFLRLSMGAPPASRRTHRPHTGGTGDEPPSSRRGGGFGSDYGDQNTDRSAASPRVSLVHSDAMPSPSTGLTSPRTPTSMSAAQRFSLQSPHPPPNYSPPPVPDQNRHSRTRTDSSSVLAFNGTNDSNNANSDEGEKEMDSSQDLPIWALGWNQELSNEIAVAH